MTSQKTRSNKVVRDDELIRRFNRGDESAFTEIYYRYQERICKFVFLQIRKKDDAAEITHETFARAHRGLERFRRGNSLAVWLHRIAFNLARNRYWFFFRRRKKDAPSFGTLLFPAGIDLPPVDIEKAEAEEAAAKMTGICIEKLDTSDREIIILRVVLEYSYSEIAAALGVSLEDGRKRISSARRRFGKLMKEASMKQKRSRTE